MTSTGALLWACMIKPDPSGLGVSAIWLVALKDAGRNHFLPTFLNMNFEQNTQRVNFEDDKNLKCDVRMDRATDVKV